MKKKKIINIGFTPENVTTDQFGHELTFTRQQVESWLAGMDCARRAASDTACREEVARTIEARKKSGQKSTSALPRLAVILLFLCALCVSVVNASEIIRGYAPQDGQQLYAADLDNLIDESTIGVQFYNDQQTTPVLGSGYYFLVLNPANQTYYRIPAQQVLYGNTNIFLNVAPESVPAYGTLLFYDPTNNWIGSTTVSNFLWNSASNINVAGLSFANTNNGGATNRYVLPVWPNPGPSGVVPNWTNYPANFLLFDTNGVPYRIGLSNLELNVALDLGTVYGLRYEYLQEFYPWLLYGTNPVSPFTNSFGWATNFPITSFFQTNKDDSQTNATLLDGDTIPINSHTEGGIGVGPTNTSATLYSIYQYMTNKNALPPYTIARAQFSGIYGSWNLTNMSAATGIITNLAAAVNWSNPSPVSVQFLSGNPYTPNLYSNTLYWAQVTNAPVLSFQIFTNLANAQQRVNPVLGSSGYIANYETLLWLTNYTAVNCGVIQECLGTAIEPGWFGCFFITPSATPYYYVSGSVMAVVNTTTAAYAVGFLNYNGYTLYTTNGFAGLTTFETTGEQAPLVQVLVQPQ